MVGRRAPMMMQRACEATRVTLRSKKTFSHFHRKIHLTKPTFLDISTRQPLPENFLAGQPTHETRPHYLPIPGFLTPGITAEEYYERRLTLASKLPPNSAAVLVGNTITYASGSVFHHFQQDNDFYYLTGWLEPNSAAVIVSGKSPEDHQFYMFVPEGDLFTQKWEGARLGTAGAYNFFNADEAFDITQVGRHLPKLLDSSEFVYWDDKSPGNSPSGPLANVASQFTNFFNKGTQQGKNSDSQRTARNIQLYVQSLNKKVRPLSSIVAEQREIKSDAEIDVMHALGMISSRAINQAMARVGSSSPFKTEKALGKYLEYAFVVGGCDKEAYIPVVASGENALTIHYTRNDDLLYQDELVFIDAGGKLGGYCLDISRAWPNSPRGFSDAQRDLYQVVLNVNKKCIDLCYASGMSLHDIHEESVKLFTQELRNVPGFSNVNQLIVSRELYPHYIGHHLGLDLHDIPSTSRFKAIVPGNVLTIEPGLYVPKDDKFPKWFQGIGVRVEDDIVVGHNQDNILNLSSLCVKEIADIELLIASGKVTTPGAYQEAVVLDI